MAPPADNDGQPGQGAPNLSDGAAFPQPRRVPSSRDSAWVTRLMSAAAMIAAIAGIAARLAYETYYRTLGLGVDDVGLGTARMLTLGGVSLVGIAGPVGVAFGVGWLIGRRFGWPWPMAGGVAAGLAGFLALGFALRAAPLLATIAAIAVGVLCLASPLVLHSGNSTPAERSTARLSAAICIVLLLVFWSVVMKSAPSAAKHLGTPRTHPDLATAVLDIHPEQVCVTPVATSVRLPLHGPALYLGGAQGMVVFWDVSHRRYLKVPTGEVILSGALKGGCPPDQPNP